MSDNDNLMLLYKYRWDVSFNIPGIDKPFNADLVKLVEEIVNPKENVLTEYRIECLIPNQMIKFIYNNRTSITVNAKLNEYIYYNGEIDPKTDKASSSEYIELESREVFEKTLIPYFDDLSFPSILINSALDTTEEDPEQKEETSDYRKMGFQPVIMTLYEQKFLNTIKRQVNLVLYECTIADAIATVLNNSAHSIEHIVFDKPDNEIKYSNIIIPPYNIVLAMKYLQNQYGIYKTGLNLFFSENTLYILDSYRENHEYIENIPHITKIDIYNLENSEPFNTVILKSEKNGYSYKTITNIKEIDLTSEMAEIDGDEFIFSNLGLSRDSLDYQNGKLQSFRPPVASIRKGTGSHSASGLKRTNVYDELNNVYNLNSIILERGIQRNIIFQLEGIARESLAPNKKLNINFIGDTIKEKIYSKNYFISSYTISYVIDPRNVANDQGATTQANAIITSINTKEVEGIDSSGINFDISSESNIPSKKWFNLFNRKNEEDDSDYFSVAEVTRDIVDTPEVEPDLNAVLIDVTKGKPYFSQRDNKYDPMLTCNVTSYAMALNYANKPLPAPSGIQAEDWLSEKILSDESTPDWDKFCIENPWARSYNRREIHAFLPIVTNRLYGKEVIKFHESLGIKNILFQLCKKQNPVIISGDYRSLGVNIPGHISVMVGFLTNQKDINNINDPTQIDTSQIVKVLMNDPFGDPSTGYQNTRGEKSELSYKLAIKLFKPLNNPQFKLAHTII